MTGIVRAFMLVASLLALVFLLLGAVSLRQRRWLGTTISMLAGALFLTLGALCATISVGIRGYRELTREDLAATVVTYPLGPQRFRATVTLPDSSVHMYDLAGDALYVDAHILKWRPLANVLGLHTAYELDRIGGRYQKLADEQTRERTVYSLATDKPFNTFDLARRYWLLRPFVDAQYGSATFINATTGSGRAVRDARQVTYEVLVSTTGLLVRAAEPR